MALIRALGAYMEVEDVTEPALCALRHMTTRHAMAEQAQTDVRVYNGIPVVLQLLAKMRAPIAKASLGLVRNLAQLESNLVPLRDERVVSASGPQTVVTLAVDVLTRAFTQIKETQMVDRFLSYPLPIYSIDLSARKRHRPYHRWCHYE